MIRPSRSIRPPRPENPTGTLNIINGTWQTYTYDFNNILPGLPKGKYGTISYGQADISLVTQSGYYYDSRRRRV